MLAHWALGMAALSLSLSLGRESLSQVERNQSGTTAHHG